MLATTQFLISLDDARCAAMEAGSIEQLTELLADDLVYRHGNGETDSKTSYLEAMLSGSVRYRKVTPTQREVICGPGLAALRGRVDVLLTRAGQSRELRLEFLALWVDHGRGWQMTRWFAATVPS